MLLDLGLGEPPAAAHPVVWMGAFIRRHSRPRHRSSAAALIQGALVTAGGIAAAWGAAAAIQGRLSRRGRPLARALVHGLVLKPTLAVHALFSAVREVEGALRNGDLPRARKALGANLVSRDTGALRPAEVAAAAIESLAENLSDSVVAPLLAHRVAGLPGAMAYRFVNTADALLGYRTPELEWLGKVPARADDLLNLAPARVTATLIALAAPAGGGSPARAWRIARRDGCLTASPNAGWPIAAMAGALDRRLGKRDAYVLLPEAREPAWQDIGRARRIAAAACAAALLLA